MLLNIHLSGQELPSQRGLPQILDGVVYLKRHLVTLCLCTLSY